VPITTASAYTAEPGATTLTLTYPAGDAGDTLLVWMSNSDASTPAVSGDLTLAEQVTSIASTGRLRVYKRTRLAGDTSATWTTAGDTRKLAIAANLPANLDSSDPTSFGLFANPSATVTPGSHPAGPGLMALWFSFSDVALDPPGTLLEWPTPDSDVTVGFELRLYQIAAETDISEAPPTNPSLSLALRAVSYTTIDRGGWSLGKVGWSG
jgi:hypothetical protein